MTAFLGNKCLFVIRWDQIIRICFLSGDLFQSDELYVFTDQRPESYAIPLDGKGGLELWNEIITRGLFDAELAIRAASSTSGDLLCWPTPDDEEV